MTFGDMDKMAGAVNIQSPSIPGVSPLSANSLGQAATGNPATFGATLEKFLAQATTDKKKADPADKPNPLQALNQLLQMGGAGAQSGLAALQNLGGLRSETEQLQSQFETGFKQLMSAQGLDLRSGVSLQADASGEIRVSNDHPDKLFIESALKNNPELSDVFRKLAAKSSVLHASEMVQKSQQAYGNDPQQALAQFEQMLGKQTEQMFSLTITNDGAQNSFTAPPANAVNPVL